MSDFRVITEGLRFLTPTNKVTLFTYDEFGERSPRPSREKASF